MQDAALGSVRSPQDPATSWPPAQDAYLVDPKVGVGVKVVIPQVISSGFSSLDILPRPWAAGLVDTWWTHCTGLRLGRLAGG